jgi:ATP phosphoribosyltransferase
MSQETKRVLKLGLPSGSMQESTFDLFRRAGHPVSLSSRSYYPSLDDPELSAVLFRSQEMSRYVEDGVVDVGLTGHDWICENQSDVVEVAELIYSKAQMVPVRWVLAVPNESPVRQPEQLAGGIVATELVGVVRRYFQDRGIDVRVEFSWGATEVKARMVDAIVDLTETGSSLRANNLRVIDTIMTSTTRLIANRAAWADDWKRTRIEDLSLLLAGAMAARQMVGLKLNVHRDNLDAVLALLPAEKSPTVSPLAEAGWSAVEVILDERIERSLTPQLKRAGASGIFTYSLNKVIP